ncbi:hypothetical protein HMPREF9554_01920 [Treponema phagedenis F0421]|nr:hypothetical protein HMPREF9554_01920 [Treponema phagedenis F0421]
MAVVPSRIEFKNYLSILGVFKLIGFILPRTSKLSTATDGMVPNRNDVLKQSGSKQKRCFKAKAFVKL